MDQGIYVEGARFTPYWWEAAPRPEPAPVAPPASVDVVVIGAGITGLSAALSLSRGGRSVVVFEAGAVGEGASSRNGGMCGGAFKIAFSELAAKIGAEAAAEIWRDGCRALDFLADLIAREGIQCHFARMGRFVGAHTPGHYEAMARETELWRRHVGIEADMLPRAEQGAEIGSPVYHGGRLIHRDGGLHPGLYHQGLYDRATAAGALVAADTPVTAVAREGQGFTVTTPRGRMTARDVIVASNGYTGRATPYFRRRLIPVGSFMIATEPLPAETMARLIPKGRMITDTKRILSYYRPSPDGTRILFGGRAAYGQNEDLRRTGAILRDHMCRIFPELEGTRLTHSWTGNVAFTFDRMPHVGVHDGLHYAIGYCGSGVVKATYYGHKTALKVLGDKDAATALDGRPFPSLPFYSGDPWFLPLVATYYHALDRLAGGQSRGARS